jgi:hypothetical protein
MLASLGACAGPMSSPGEEATGEGVQGVTSALNPGQYQIHPSYALSECASTASFNTGSGGSGDIWTCATSGDPNWSIVQVSSAVYEIHQAASGNCLSIAGGAVNTKSTATSLSSCNGQVGSRWNVAQVGSNYTFTSTDNTNMCLDMVGGHNSDGTVVDVYTCTGKSNQQFRLTPSVSSVSATVAVTSSGSRYAATVTVTNSSTTAQSNWQVALNLNESTIDKSPSYGGATGITGGEVVYNNGLAILTPTGAGTLGAGASVQVTFTGDITGSNWTPTIANVDGIAGSSAPATNDGVDHIARAVATGALNVVTAWESGRTTTDQTDFTLLDSHLYTVSSDGTQIVFQSRTPATWATATSSTALASASSALATAQMDPSVASYLVSGLLSCFADATSQYTYGVNWAAMRGWSYTTKAQNTTVGASTGFDNISRVGANVNGTEEITLTETVNSGGEDTYFGIASSLVYSALDGWTTGPEFTKYQGSKAVPCSPFNGPGGPANPALLMTLNGDSVGARQVISFVDCTYADHCTSTVVLDPVAYASPGQFYDTNSNLMGTSTNPFALEPNVVVAYNPDHMGQWAEDVSGNWGMFSKKTFSGGTYLYKWNMCSGGTFNSNGC